MSGRVAPGREAVADDTGRVLAGHEPWLIGDMLGHAGSGPVTPVQFAEFTRSGMNLYVIEDASGPLGTGTFMAPAFIKAVIADAFWVRPEQRGKTMLLHTLIRDILRATSRPLMIAQAQPNVLADNSPYSTPLKADYNLIHTHEGMFVYAPG